MRHANLLSHARQRGVATVELVFMVIWMWFLGVAMFTLVHYLYQFVVSRHATQAAATYVATMPHYQLHNSTEILAARALVQRIVRENIEGAGIPSPGLMDVLFYCGDFGDACRERDAAPGVPVHITVEYTFSDPFWNTHGFGTGGNMGADEMWRVEAHSSAVFLK